MNRLLSCEFNVDTGNVECRFMDGTVLAVDCDAAENNNTIAPDGNTQKWLISKKECKTIRQVAAKQSKTRIRQIRFDFYTRMMYNKQRREDDCNGNIGRIRSI